MAFRIVMLLGTSVWTRRETGWRRAIVQEGGAAAHSALDLLAEVACEPFPQGTVLVYEPDGLVHQEVETPKVGRSVFASLARVKSEHPVVVSDDLGWGMEAPEPTPSGSYATVLHHELTPGLARIRSACAATGSRLPAAWSAFSAASSCLGAHLPDTKARTVLFLIPGFIAVAVCAGGKRSFKTWAAPMAERDWRALAAVTGEFDSRKSPSMADFEHRKGSVLVISDGDPKGHCPIWEEIKASGRVEAVLGLDALALGASQLPLGNPGNLLEAFPTPLNLDPYLYAAAAAGVIFALYAGIASLGERKALVDVEATNAARETVLGERLAVLARNEEEMASLRNSAPDAPGFLPADRYAALQGLGAAIPDALTLTAFSIARDDMFQLEAKLVGGDLDANVVREALVRSGFMPGPGNSWTFDAVSRRLSVRGRYGDPQP